MNDDPYYNTSSGGGSVCQIMTVDYRGSWWRHFWKAPWHSDTRIILWMTCWLVITFMAASYLIISKLWSMMQLWVTLKAESCTGQKMFWSELLGEGCELKPLPDLWIIFAETTFFAKFSFFRVSPPSRALRREAAAALKCVRGSYCKI